jgi:poly(A) polymerase
MTEQTPEVFPAREISGELHPILLTAIDPDAAFVLRRLHQAGHRAYLVGGCVRDLLLGGTPKDFDIATSARPRQVKKLFRNARIIGRRFRLVHVMFGPHKQIEVSTFRRAPKDEIAEEPELLPAHDFGDEPDAGTENGGAADAENGDPANGDEHGGAAGRDDFRRGARESAAAARSVDDVLADPEGNGDGEEDEDLLIREDNVYGSEAEDAVRRDFTINGLFYDTHAEEVIDYVGGVADLRRRTLRTIGEASRRVREDPVRILRAVKFSTRLGLALDPLLASAMAEHHEDVVKSAAPRVFEEILRMLGGHAPERSIEVLVGLGVMRVLFPELGLRPHGAEEDPRLKRLLARLAAAGQVDRGRRSLPTAIYVAILFYDELLARLVGSEQPIEGPHPPPSQSLDEFLRPIGQRCRMAKRDTARVRAMFLALRRIDPALAEPRGRKRRRRGGLGEFVRREFFDDALLLLRIVATAEGRDLAPVLDWERKRDEILSHRRDSPPPHHHPRHDHDRGPHRPDHDRAPLRTPQRDHAPESSQSPPDESAEPSSAPDTPPHRRRRRRRRGRGNPVFDSPSPNPPDDSDAEPA